MCPYKGTARYPRVTPGNGDCHTHVVTIVTVRGHRA